MPTKISGGKFRGITIITPETARPTTSSARGAITSSLKYEIKDSKVLDIFAGSGAMGLEILSHGAESITFIEKSQASCKVIKQNINKCNASKNCKVIAGDAIAKIQKIELDFSIVFIDPPFEYMKNHMNKISQIIKIIYDNNLRENFMIILEIPKELIDKFKESISSLISLEINNKKYATSNFLIINKR